MEHRSHKMLNCLFMVCALVLSGCSDDSGSTFSTVIDFTKDTYPDSVARVEGLSNKEDWGRWSDAEVAPTIKIHFKKPLPKTFAVTLLIRATEKNDNPIIRIGSFSQEIFILNSKEPISLDVDLHEPTDTIEIIPPKPTSPKILGLSDDARKLGIGLHSIKIEE